PACHKLLPGPCKAVVEESPDWPVVVVATTSHPTALSSDMHEGFLHCVPIEAPNEVARQLMLESLFVEVTQDSDVDTTHAAQRTAVSRNEMLYSFSHNHSCCEKLSRACR
ncbi:hypothetical protein NP493_1557g00002, partial [Ridgeia piscesae]